MYQQFIDQFIQQEILPAAYRQDIADWFLPLSEELVLRRQSQQTGPLLVGINGAQGTGKSTLAKLLASLLQAQGLRTVALSIDDFYFGKTTRQQLATEIHPLLASRGVPGTHDVKLLLQILAQLVSATATDEVRLPLFNKASDDCMPTALCPTIKGSCDILLVEGWFVGVQPQTEQELKSPINALEQEQDADGRWRQYVNQKLGDEYQDLFRQLHVLLMLQAPGFEQVYEWRSVQEEKLRSANNKANTDQQGMNQQQLNYFIQHFERLTRHCLATLPPRADTVFVLDQHHRVIERRQAGLKQR